MVDEERWRLELARLDAAIRPIAKREVDLSDPDWQAKLAGSYPLDEAGVRDEAEALLLDILLGYVTATDMGRRAVRALVDEYLSFFWAAATPAGGTAAADLRLRLIHFALLDQRRDPRDAVLWLDDLCRAPEVPPGEAASLRQEVALMASDEDRYGFGSTRSMLLRGYGEYVRVPPGA
jgi:hypothetical protein